MEKDTENFVGFCFRREKYSACSVVISGEGINIPCRIASDVELKPYPIRLRVNVCVGVVPSACAKWFMLFVRMYGSISSFW